MATLPLSTTFAAGDSTVKLDFSALWIGEHPEDFDLVNDRFTPQVPGLYNLTAQLRSGDWEGGNAWLELNCSGGTGNLSRFGILDLRAYEILRNTWVRHFEPGDWCQIQLSKQFTAGVSPSSTDLEHVNSFFEAYRIGN